MADWSVPTLTTDYDDVLSELMARDVDAGTQYVAAPTNPPDGAIRFNRGTNIYEQYSTGTGLWTAIVLAIAGGGTGATSAAGIRTALSLGTMALQNSNAVAITAGAVAADLTGSTNLNATALSIGTVPTARLGTGVASSTSFLRGDQTWQVLSSALTGITIAVKTPVRTADFTVDFTNDMEPLGAGPHTVTLPTVVGRGGKRVSFVFRSTTGWVFSCNGSETIMGVVSQTIFFGQYSSFTLEADANSGLWDIL